MFRVQKELYYIAIQDRRNLFKLEKETKLLKIEYLQISRVFLGMNKKNCFNLKLKQLSGKNCPKICLTC